MEKNLETCKLLLENSFVRNHQFKKLLILYIFSGARGIRVLTNLLVFDKYFFWELFMAFRPLHDRVVVQAVESESKSAGGIIIPDTAKEKPSQGKVISVGPGARDIDGNLVALELKKGDTVLYGKYSGTEVKIDGKDMLIMRESDVMGVVE